MIYKNEDGTIVVGITEITNLNTGKTKKTVEKYKIDSKEKI